MRLGRAEILDVVAGHLVGVSAQRRNFHTGEHGFERRRVHLDVPEDVFAAEQGWKEVVDRGEESIAAKLPGMAMALETERFRHVQAMFAGTARQDGRPAKAVGNVGDLGQRIARIAARFLEVARKLRSQMAS